jgi:hypothetical protein
MKDDQWQESETKIPDIEATDEEDDSYDAWNDFTGSAGTQNPSGIISSPNMTAGNFEFSADLSDTKTAEDANSFSNRDFNWMENDQRQDK